MEIEVLCEILAPAQRTTSLEVFQGVSFTVPVGGGGGGTVQVWNETPAGVINGINLSFSTFNPFRSSSLALYLNGLRQRPTGDYIVTGANVFQMVLPPLVGDTLSVDYTLP